MSTQVPGPIGKDGESTRKSLRPFRIAVRADEACDASEETWLSGSKGRKKACTWNSKGPKIMGLHFKMESIGSIGSIVLGFLEVQVQL